MKKTIFALGFFDGVHLGHQALLKESRALADRLGCQAGVVTFLGHPEALVRGTPPALLNNPYDRGALFREYGMDTVKELVFDRARMEQSWEDFFREVVSFGAAGLVCGSDFRFGKGGAGTAQALREVCREAGIPCVIVPEQRLYGVRVSSTHIRALLEQGDIGQANRFLGHPHRLSGTVEPGRHLGRTIGVPTANLAYPEDLVKLPHGVYACRVNVGGKAYRAVTNVGTRPTVEGTTVKVEAWLPDYAGDLYGQTITVEFFRFLRPERKFASLEELKTQILIDAEETRKMI